MRIGPVNHCRGLLRSMILACCLCSPLTAQRDVFKEEAVYYDNPRTGERLSVSFPNAITELARSTELTIYEEPFYSVETSRYERRMVAIITGMGMSSKGLKLVLDDDRQLELLSTALTRFNETYRRFKNAEDQIRDKAAEWMGKDWEALSDARPIGAVYFYPSRKEMQVTFNWDFEIDRIWMSMGNQIHIDQEVVPFLSRMLESIREYRSWFFDYREEMISRNEEIDDLLGIDS